MLRPISYLLILAVFVSGCAQETTVPIPTLASLPTITPTPSHPLEALLVPIDGIYSVYGIDTTHVPGRTDVVIRFHADVAADANSLDLLNQIVPITANYLAVDLELPDKTLAMDVTLHRNSDTEQWTYSGDVWNLMRRNGILVTATPRPTAPPTVPGPITSSVSGPSSSTYSSSASGVQCNGASRCGQMTSCAQAYACLRGGNSRLDQDNDGIPCETLCGG